MCLLLVGDHSFAVSAIFTHVGKILKNLNFISLDNGVSEMYQDTVGMDGSKTSLSHWNEFSRGPPGWWAGAFDVGNAAERTVFPV